MLGGMATLFVGNIPQGLSACVVGGILCMHGNVPTDAIGAVKLYERQGGSSCAHFKVFDGLEVVNKLLALHGKRVEDGWQLDVRFARAPSGKKQV